MSITSLDTKEPVIRFTHWDELVRTLVLNHSQQREIRHLVLPLIVLLECKLTFNRNCRPSANITTTPIIWSVEDKTLGNCEEYKI